MFFAVLLILEAEGRVAEFGAAGHLREPVQKAHVTIIRISLSHALLIQELAEVADFRRNSSHPEALFFRLPEVVRRACSFFEKRMLRV